MSCDECGKEFGHEVWCNFFTGSRQPVVLPKKIWVAVTDGGREIKFSMSPRATKEKAFDYALRLVSDVTAGFQSLVEVREA